MHQTMHRSSYHLTCSSSSSDSSSSSSSCSSSSSSSTSSSNDNNLKLHKNSYSCQTASKNIRFKWSIIMRIKFDNNFLRRYRALLI